ncbi:MAG TPA: sulfatase-like hydrolase/transferase [Anaerohalosphaeraceae bacterium]|jgi:arylsulfatase A-like enzyme|nr:sulfatase-like hydrolase/transferase [Anaerohalosphaeraceae bacterium]HRT50274.1 sulfatase-like hydrolase/transferase [Anaerohalosphaeraceae bacterium]HRT86205.1 sulfatase-like hydrolase/transferase [Anaerohalosphaeraceae bacterium]
MDRRGFLKAAGVTVASLALGATARLEAARKRTNILFIMSDDHASHAMSCYGSRINKTPNLDRIANEGMRFDNCFCTNGICAPSRAVILTGKHSHINGHIDNTKRFDGSQVTFPKLLQAAGYQTAIVGKWHLQSDPTGFDYWNILPGQGDYYNPVMIEMGQRKKYTGYVTDIITDVCIDWLKRRDADRPFCLMYHHKAPHRNWQPGPKHLTLYDDVTMPEPPTLFDDYATRSDAARQQEMTVERHLNAADLKLTPPKNLTEEQAAAWNAAYEPKNKAFTEANLQGKDLVRWKYQRYIKDYLRCIASIDENVGRVLDYLDEAGLADNTLVFYTSDQGFYLGDHGWFDKRFMYEESLRMPLVARLPGSIRPGSVSADMIQNLDFAPTFLDYAGVEIPAEMQGRSFRKILEGRTPADWRESIYYHYYEYPAVHAVKRHYGVRTLRYKLIHYYYDIDAWELYDLKNDPQELKNVYDDPQYAGVAKEMKAQLQQLRKLYGDSDELARQLRDGMMKHPDFDAVYNASIRKTDNGYAIAAQGSGFALKKLAKPITGKAVFKTRLRTLRTDGTRNGLICFGPGDRPDDLIKCGLYIGAGEYIVQYGGFGGPETLRTPAQFDKNKTFDVTVAVDLPSGTLLLTVDGEEIAAPLKRPWKAINYYGCMANSTETAFSTIQVNGD